MDYTTSDFDRMAFDVHLNGLPITVFLPAGFESITIPVLISKEYYFDDNVRSWPLFGGISAGMLMLSSVENNLLDNLNSENIYQEGNPFQNAFHLSVDAGLEVDPFQQLPNFRVGLLSGIQVNSTRFPNPYTIIFKSQSGSGETPFVLDIHPRQAINISLVFSYTFFKQKRFKNKRLKKVNPFSCPK